MNEAPDALTQSFLHKNMAESTTEEIRAITQSYPYFAPAQLALLQKLKQENNAEYAAQLQIAVLYYYDPIQFEAFVHTEKFTTDFDFDLADTTKPISDNMANETVEPISGEAGQSPIAIVTETAPEIPADGATNAEPEPSANTEDISEIKEEISADSTEEVQTNAAPISVGQPTISLPEEADNQPLAFEPYHTVDYFASQGIKLSQEEASTGRVGKQLRSFTEWLKTMKRLPAANMEKDMDPASEHKVLHLANHSIETTDIVTETMAEVWLKQGNIEKAIEVYNKLSLQNPAKRAYFAAKIDRLKKVP